MNSWPIPLLTPKDLDFAVVNYNFTSFTADFESELPTIEGFIDTTLLDFAASIAEQIPLIASLFDGLDDLASIPGEIDASDNIASTLSDLANTAAAADATLGDFNGQIGGSAGGNNGGSTPGTVPIQNQTAQIDSTSCATGIPWPATNSEPLPFTQSVPLKNASQSTVQIASITLVQPHPGTFTAVTDCTGTLAPGETCNVVITQNQEESNGVIFALDLKLSTPAKTERICLQVGLNVGAPTGGVGGSGAPIFG